ncbi:MAG: type II toxin-antitoxin system VapC family toxin [Candidatus Cryptobacteroides sp.]
MTKTYLDTNILLDFLLGREGCKDTALILQLGREGKIRLYCSILSIADAFYILRKNVGKIKALDAIKTLQAQLNILPMGDMTLYSTLKNCGPDFEDTLQKECAESAFCDYFLTRNPKDFPSCAIPILSPKDFLKFCKE